MESHLRVRRVKDRATDERSQLLTINIELLLLILNTLSIVSRSHKVSPFMYCISAHPHV